ncbi:RNA-directed DNA polymerase like [Apostasia shenzhenica]|uniref:RNA-directed DNA polymerase like n=1 Tax=Apostasia shenzhenica TaxID=1088818 RepID=A0A2H9ZRY2_9ASPA|nr:RNA-directed DNA polymerase like [Apostasia shenzhenica]
MPGIQRAVAEHRLSLKPEATPVRQKKRSFDGEKQRAIREEVEKLLAAGFIREITYPSWLANVVVVKKNSGKWRMCVDFTNLNKACPKDFYPLPKIDRLVDCSAGYSMMSFVDAFSGYHQIRMAENDEEHTSFITDQGTFCYKVMPFGLKNAGATYQRMIDTVLKNQRGRNIEAYVDDVLIKSKCVKQHIEDLRETLDTCRTYNIKINPLKSIFGSSYDKFLGHMVSARGIEANLEKIQAIQEMKPPQTVQDIQKLNGRVTALSRFISKSGECCLPFFKILRGENQAWNEDCAKAFQSLKEYLLSPPLLSAPVQDEDLFLYLSATNNSVSVVLVREEAVRQHPIHYISHILHGAEVRYPPLKKLSFALISAARRLRHYFQAHPIKVMTDQPLWRILHSLEISGRLQKWAVELSEFDIDFLPRTTMKSQALADFIAELTTTEQPELRERPQPWTLHVDGASGERVQGVGLVLTSPWGIRLQRSGKIHFPVTNNQAEYEALIAGLKFAKGLEAQQLDVYSDSKLMVNQLTGSYQTKDEVLKRYFQLVKTLLQHFTQASLFHIPREMNSLADELAKEENDNVLDILFPAFEDPQIFDIDSNPGSWMDDIRHYLLMSELPDDRNKARRLRLKAARYIISQGQLFRRCYSLPLAKCIREEDSKIVLEQIHSGDCETHAAGRNLALQVLRQGYYWPNLQKDAKELS